MELTKKDLIHYAKIEKSKRSFWQYCKTIYPNFYKEDRTYLKELCDTLQQFYFDDTEFMIINAPP